MRFLIRGRQQGKTTDLLSWMREAPEGVKRIMAVHDRRTVDRMLLQNPDLKLWQFIAIWDLERYAKQRCTEDETIEVCIDNVDLCLQMLMPRVKLELVSGTGELS